MGTVEVQNEAGDNSMLVKGLCFCGAGLSSIIERTLSAIDNITHAIWVMLSGATYIVTGIVDFTIRAPVKIIVWLLFAIQTILETIIYVFLDLFLYGFSEILICTISSITNAINVIIRTPFYVLNCTVSCLFSIVINYARAIDFIVFKIVFPVGDVIYWYAAFVLTVVGIFHVTMECTKLTKSEIKTLWHQHGYKFLIMAPLLYAALDIWRIVLSLILIYALHPAVYMFIFLCVSLGIVALAQLLHESVRQPVRNRYEQAMRSINGLLYLTRARSRLTRLWLQRNCNALELFWRRNFQERAQQNDTPQVRLQTNLIDAEIANECVICFERKSFITILPCMHSNICQTCVSQLLQNDYRCPLCRGTIMFIRS
ncbi:uncharacterized protein LOC127862769 [Dreissena polymorpha]|uniref:RING-type domain-containing protein n=1 Tax=Dreissena polymorpha TaxID=45954 RepID=A0A9D3YA87_DREPO|nr:uncharacterized protein LOC127862769 [Dreissena polymorpha]XP_052257987.1 uncharacterized protein LOC127862769 [Dreissena polymorpha]XP_052257988.1 uncharacterized protein LOC127862769 [Dreissena polymorpha]KAH3696678.1 hypothetical protein DPMN_084154 [Dreissena polymorpha]